MVVINDSGIHVRSQTENNPLVFQNDFSLNDFSEENFRDYLAFIPKTGFILINFKRDDRTKGYISFYGIGRYMNSYYSSQLLELSDIFNIKKVSVVQEERVLTSTSTVHMYSGRDLCLQLIIYGGEEEGLKGRLASPPHTYEQFKDLPIDKKMLRIIYMNMIYYLKNYITYGAYEKIKYIIDNIEKDEYEHYVPKEFDILFKDTIKPKIVFVDMNERGGTSQNNTSSIPITNNDNIITPENGQQRFDDEGEDEGTINREQGFVFGDEEEGPNEEENEEIINGTQPIVEEVDNNEEEEDIDPLDITIDYSVEQTELWDEIKGVITSGDMGFDYRIEDYDELKELSPEYWYRSTATNISYNVENDIVGLENNQFYPLINLEYEVELWDTHLNEENSEEETTSNSQVPIGDDEEGGEDEDDNTFIYPVGNNNQSQNQRPPVMRASDRASVRSRQRRREYAQRNNLRRNVQRNTPPAYNHLTYRKDFVDVIINRFLCGYYDTISMFVHDCIRLPFSRNQFNKIKKILFEKNELLYRHMNDQIYEGWFKYVIKDEINNFANLIFEYKRKHETLYNIDGVQYKAHDYYYQIATFNPLIAKLKVSGYLRQLARAWNKLVHALNGNGMILSEWLKSEEGKDFFDKKHAIMDERNYDFVKVTINKSVDLSTYVIPQTRKRRKVTEENAFLDKEKTISSDLNPNSCYVKYANCPEVYVNVDLDKKYYNHINKKEFPNSKKITQGELFNLKMFGYRFQDEELEKERKEEIDQTPQQTVTAEGSKPKVEPVIVEPIQTITNVSMDEIPYHLPETIKNFPIREPLQQIITSMTVGSARDSLVDTYRGLLYSINYVAQIDTKRGNDFITVPVKSPVTCATIHTAPVLSRRGQQQTGLPTTGEINVTPHIFRVALNHLLSSHEIQINANWQELYNNIEIGANHTVFRGYFASNFENVLAKGVFQKLILNTTKLPYQRFNDVARWLTLYLRAQQQSDVLDKNVINPIVDMQVTGTPNAAAKVRSLAYVDPNNNALPQLFPLHDFVSVDNAGNRILPAGVCTLTEYVNYIINNEDAPAMPAGITKEHISNGQVAVIFVYPHMQDKRLSMAEYTIAHCAHPMFHWTNRYSAGYVERMEDAAGVQTNTDRRGFVDPAYQTTQFDYVLQSNNVRVDGATLGVLYVSVTQVEANIRLPGNTNLTFAANGWFRAGAALVDIRGVLQAYQTGANFNDRTWINVQQWLRTETSNVADIVQARVICSNLSHLSYLSPQESQTRRRNFVGAIAQNARWPSPHPNPHGGGTRPWEDFYSDTVDLNDNPLPNTDCAYTAESFLHATSMMGQRVRAWVNVNETTRNYEHSIGTVSPLQRLMFVLGIMESKDKAKIDFITNQGCHEIVAGSKRIAECIHIMSDMIYSVTTATAGVLIAPVLAGIRDTYTNMVVSRYYDGKGPQSNEIKELYDMLTLNNCKSKDFFDHINFPGQYASQPAMPYLNIIAIQLGHAKWQRGSKLFGFGEHDHLNLPKVEDMSWKGQKDQVARAAGRTMRWNTELRTKWKDNLNLLSWTRLRMVRLTGEYIHGYDTNYWRVWNYILPNNQSFSSTYIFLTECGLNMFRPPYSSANSWVITPCGTIYTFFSELNNRNFFIGTVDSIVPWSTPEHGFFFTPTGTTTSYKYDVHAPTLNDIPPEHFNEQEFF